MSRSLRALAVLALALASLGVPAPVAAKNSSHHKGAKRPSTVSAPANGGTPYIAPPLGRPPVTNAASEQSDGGTTAAAQGASTTVGATAQSRATVGGASEPTGSSAASGPTGPTGPTGATGVSGPTSTASHARILADGLAAAPADAPAAVRQAIAAGNQLIGKPYVYGGGHLSFVSDGYDCSGTVSYALHGADLLAAPLDSSEFEQWGLAGAGSWITVYTNPAHAYVDIAGIRLDTSTAGDPGGLTGPRWRPLLKSNSGFSARHPAGL